MAREQFTVGYPSNLWSEQAAPLDGKIIFNSLEQAIQQLQPDRRYKGQKFTVKGYEDEKPVEYWFTVDYQDEEGDWEQNDEVTEENCLEFGNGKEGFAGWEWIGKKAVIPEPVPYLPEILEEDLKALEKIGGHITQKWDDTDDDSDPHNLKGFKTFVEGAIASGSKPPKFVAHNLIERKIA